MVTPTSFNDYFEPGKLYELSLKGPCSEQHCLGWIGAPKSNKGDVLMYVGPRSVDMELRKLLGNTHEQVGAFLLADGQIGTFSIDCYLNSYPKRFVKRLYYDRKK